jgi:hypothetical protein
MFEMTPSVIDARSCVPFEPQKLEFSSCQNFIELPRCQLDSHTQSVLNSRTKLSLTFLAQCILGYKVSKYIPCEQEVLIELAINSGDFW